MGENGDICIVELCTEQHDNNDHVVSFDDFYDRLRNTKEVTLKSKIDHLDYPSEFRLTLTLTTNCNSLKLQVREFLVSSGRVGQHGER